jgi:hypothetical protein
MELAQCKHHFWDVDPWKSQEVECSQGESRGEAWSIECRDVLPVIQRTDGVSEWVSAAMCAMVQTFRPVTTNVGKSTLMNIEEKSNVFAFLQLP